MLSMGASDWNTALVNEADTISLFALESKRNVLIPCALVKLLRLGFTDGHISFTSTEIDEIVTGNAIMYQKWE
jgi:hypothetical protein